MPGPAYTADDFAKAMMGLLPRGKVWPRDFDTIIRATIAGLAQTYQRQTESGNGLLVDSFPATSVELLAEWEETLGLPDPCQGPAPTIFQRQVQVLARFVKTGGQNAATFIALAAQLGYDVTITEFTTARFGMRFGDRFGGDDWVYVWQINAPLYNPQPFRFGQGRMGDRFSTWGNTVLECELNAAKPAHTLLLFSYT